MGTAISFVFGTLILGTTVFAMNLFFVGVAGVLRLVPMLLPLAGRALWGLLVFSCRLYYLLLTRIAPFIQRTTKVKILSGLWRLGTTLSMSLVLGLSLLFVLHLPINAWTVIPVILHGLFVDFVWDEIPGLSDLHMGVRT